MRAFATVFVMLLCALNVQAQRVGLAYWNVDRLYDTIPSPFRYDSEFTPSGRYRWTAERYERKVRQVAAVLDSMAMPVAVVYGVENEAVVRDIAAAATLDYSYLHRTLNSPNGLEFAIFYFGDALLPRRVVTDGRSVAVHCEVAGRRMVLLLSRSDGDAARMAAEVRRGEPDAALIVMGRCDAAQLAPLGIADPFSGEERAGRGTTVRNGVWCLDERICTDTLLRTRASIYARRRLFDRRGRAPEPTFTGVRYAGGASRWLPMTVTVE